ncbi:haloacid dehalogenase [Methanothermobacter thermautotrophicus]|uniref:Haloacid dehalogenase n=1 Tax=Methanothermobacter thermautotrophicus TaxID=145262 RepID=A0A842YMV1_METTF|nr:HAD hydrolase-like protein [Methanothermobacter thermautotrophicus]MBE2899930.1 haloacid dehalogenase [Methanothermobacter thermautotrophicus]
MMALFDVDKTLIHRSYAHEDAFRHAFREVYGVDAGVDSIDYHGKTDPSIAEEVLLLKGLEDAEIEMHLDEFLVELREYVKHNIKGEDIELIDGVDEFLSFLKSMGVSIGLVTGNLMEIAFMKLERAGIAGYFSFGGFGSDSPDRKKLTEIAVRRGLSLGATGVTVLFGDTPHDMMAGTHVGAVNIGISAGRYSERDLLAAGACYVFPDYRSPELRDTVLNIHDP